VTSVSSLHASTPAGRSIGAIATSFVAVTLLAFALSVDFPRAAHGFKGDEATYYTEAYSLARDFDFTFTRADLVRVWDEFPTGPEGIFLKRGRGVTLRRADGFPWIRIGKPYVVDRLFFGKAFLYPLVAAPFVRVFGTNGFLVLHALLLTACFATGTAWLRNRGSTPAASVAYAAVFLAASIVPVYFVWLTPELLNFALVFLAYFLWSFKEGDADTGGGGFLRSRQSDYAAAMLLGMATFSKPVHIGLIGPLVALALWRRQSTRAAAMLAVFIAVVGSLFLLNYVTTGDLNYQGGQRKTFYGYTGFPFANPKETFETTGQARGTDAVPLDIIATRDTFTVLRRNLEYFTFGRYSGFVPYFFPGVVSLVMFFAGARRRPLWQWMTAGIALASALGLLLYMPYTYSGGGGPVGNRYYLSFYPLFLFVTPALRRPLAPLAALGIGGLFTASLVLNPFDMSFDPGAHAKSGPVRILPIELTQLIDLPVSAKPDRSRRPLAGDPPMLAYFPDDNVYNIEGDSFWIRGRARADIILRAPAIDDALGTGRPVRIQSLYVEVENGPKSNRVTFSTDAERTSLDIAAGAKSSVTISLGGGLPYRPLTFPTNYLYPLSITSENAFVPFLELPPSTDSRVLGVRIRLIPTYDRSLVR